MDNIVVADIGKSNFCKTRTLFRFNYGQRLKIVGVDLPPTYEVHFSNEVEGTSKTQIGNEDGVLIPREYFEPGKSIFAWLFLHAAEDSGETVAQIIIPISNRAKITDEEPLPEEESAISQAIVELNKAVTQTNADVEAADAAAESAAAAQIAAEAAQQSAEAARDISNASAAASSNSADNALAYKNAAELAQQKAEQAQSKAETAQQNAEAANEAARSSAATSVEAAQISINSATESATSAQTAASSAAAAQQSASEANAYKNEAATKANEANASANAANISKNNAEAAALRAESAAQSAQTSANNAEVNADTAVASSEQAASYKSEAQIAALNAQTSASNAQTYSNNAANSASDAAVASVAAVAAKNESEQIKTNVEADATLVQNAKVAAVAAKTDAEAARDVAVSATVHSPKIEDGTWHVWNQQNDGYVDTNVTAQGPKGDKGDSYVLTEQDKADISTLVDSMKIHICTSQEYNSETGVPTIANPDTETFYLVPGGDGNNLFIEWVYVNGAWERFGSADVDLSNYVQKTDYATSDNAGVMKVNSAALYGMFVDSTDHYLKMLPAASLLIKDGIERYKAIAPFKQHESTFYGLAKAAGDTTQSQSSNAVGTYTDEAKAAIQQMLDVPSTGDIPDVPVQDVQVNGVSVLQDGVANVPVANTDELGVVKIYPAYGVIIDNGRLAVSRASDSQLKAGGDQFKVIVPVNQHKSTFYGLAKAAGADEKDSTLPVGQYTDNAKSAIRTMLGAASDNIIVISDTAPTDPDTKIWIPETATSVQVPTVSEMETALAGKVGDVQVAGTSVVGSDGIAEIPYATYYQGAFTPGIVSVRGLGIYIADSTTGEIAIAKATSRKIKTGIGDTAPIVVSNQHESIFYGLSKVAGVDLANETVTLGTYPEASKTAIKQMLGVEEGLKVVRLI